MVCQGEDTTGHIFHCQSYREWALTLRPSPSCDVEAIEVTDTNPALVRKLGELLQYCRNHSSSSEPCDISSCTICTPSKHRNVVKLPQNPVLWFSRGICENGKETGRKFAYHVDLESTLLDMSPFTAEKKNKCMYRLQSLKWHRVTTRHDDDYIVETQTGGHNNEVW